jgi:hypothetical protein
MKFTAPPDGLARLSLHADALLPAIIIWAAEAVIGMT